jgi:tetratricopeptide (TPR) repeat protein
MDIGIDTGYLIIRDTFCILGGMDAPWLAIGAIFVGLVVTGISISLIFPRRAGAGILFPLKSGSGRERKNVSTKALTGDEWCARGEQLVSAGMYREALNAYDRAYTLEKKRHELLYRRGRIFLDIGMYDQAWGQASRALAEDPYLAAAWILKGDLLCKKGNLTDARCCYRLAFYLQGKYAKPDLMDIWDELPDDPISDQW